MRTRRSIVLRRAIVPLLAQVVAWFTVKTVRVIAPALAGVVCPSRDICSEDAGKLEQANALYGEAKRR